MKRKFRIAIQQYGFDGTPFDFRNITLETEDIVTIEVMQFAIQDMLRDKGFKA